MGNTTKLKELTLAIANDLIKEVSGKTSCTRTGCLKPRTGDIIMDKHEVLKRWSEYIEELFYNERGEKP